MKLGEWIKEYRKEHGISMQVMADMCGFSKAYVGMLEKGINSTTKRPISPTMQTFQKIADGVGMDVNEFIKILDSDQPVTVAPTPSPEPTTSAQKKEIILSQHDKNMVAAYHNATKRDKAIVDMTLEPYIKEYVLGKFSKHYESFSSAIKHYYPHLSHDEAEKFLMDIIRIPSLDLAIEQLETHYATDIIIKCIVHFYSNFTEYMDNAPSLDKIKQFIHEYAPPKSQ